MAFKEDMGRQTFHEAAGQREKTNMKEVRLAAKELLDYGILRTAQSPLVIHHPFTGCGYFILLAEDSVRVTDITTSTEDFERWKDWMRCRIDEAESAYEIGLRVHQPYRFIFLKATEQFLSDEEFAKLLQFSWISSPAPSQEEEAAPSEMIEMFQRANAEYLMSPEEQSILAQLPDEAVIYRGLTDKNAFHVSGMSWTLEEESAARFARRGETGKIYQAKIRKENILALFLKGEEFEVVVDPENLQEIALERTLLLQPEAIAAERENPETIHEKKQEGVMRYDFS